MTKGAGPYAHSPANSSAPAGSLLPHLASPAAALRQVMAAHLLRSCAHIVEIGGAGRPITGFLTHQPASVTVVDPKIEAFSAPSLNGAPCRVSHVPAKLQQLALPPPPPPFGLVLLGLSLKPFGAGETIDAGLLALIRAADVLVIDHALRLARARDQIGPLLAARTDAPTISLELKIDDPALVEAGYEHRRLLAFGAF